MKNFFIGDDGVRRPLTWVQKIGTVTILAAAVVCVFVIEARQFLSPK